MLDGREISAVCFMRDHVELHIDEARTGPEAAQHIGIDEHGRPDPAKLWVW